MIFRGLGLILHRKQTTRNPAQPNYPQTPYYYREAWPNKDNTPYRPTLVMTHLLRARYLESQGACLRGHTQPKTAAWARSRPDISIGESLSGYTLHPPRCRQLGGPANAQPKQHDQHTSINKNQQHHRHHQPQRPPPPPPSTTTTSSPLQPAATITITTTTTNRNKKTPTYEW